VFRLYNKKKGGNIKIVFTVTKLLYTNFDSKLIFSFIKTVQKGQRTKGQ